MVPAAAFRATSGQILFDDVHEPGGAALISALKHQHFRPEIALDVDELKGTG